MAERISWLVLGVAIHLPPFAAFFVPSLITQLYSVQPEDPNFALLQHRAALFGLVLVSCIWAALDRTVRKIAVVLTALSMLSFLALFLAYGRPESLTMIALMDFIGLPFLVYVAWKSFAREASQ